MEINKDYLAVVKVAKEILRTPIKDILDLPVLVSASQRQPFYITYTLPSGYPNIPPRIDKKGVYSFDLFYSADTFQIYIGYCGGIVRVNGRKESGIVSIERHKTLIKVSNDVMGWKTREIFEKDSLWKHQDKTLLELAFL